MLNKIQIFWIIIPFTWYRPSIYILQSTFLKFTYSIKYELAMLSADWPQTSWNMCLHVCCSIIKHFFFCFLIITMVTKWNSQFSHYFDWGCLWFYLWMYRMFCMKPASKWLRRVPSLDASLPATATRTDDARSDRFSSYCTATWCYCSRVQENIPFSH